MGTQAEEPSEFTRSLSFLFAFLAGGVVLNVLKKELPEERESRFLLFALGLAAYAAPCWPGAGSIQSPGNRLASMPNR